MRKREADYSRWKELNLEKNNQIQEDELSIIFPIGEQAELGFLELNINPKSNIIPERKAIKSQVIKQGFVVFIAGSTLLFFLYSAYFQTT